MVDSPHFRVPFSYLAGGCPVVEQDSAEEISQCGEAALRTERGTRMGQPDFGLPDQVLLQGGANLNEIERAMTDAHGSLAAHAERQDIIRRGVDSILVTVGVNNV